MSEARYPSTTTACPPDVGDTPLYTMGQPFAKSSYTMSSAVHEELSGEGVDQVTDLSRRGRTVGEPRGGSRDGHQRGHGRVHVLGRGASVVVLHQFPLQGSSFWE